MNTNEIDFIIVGQGLAGSHVAWQALKAGYTIHIIDAHHQKNSSLAAAGIINPITGRYYVKSWMIDDLLPFAKKTYLELEDATHTKFFFEKPIIRALFSVKDENNWLGRSIRKGYEQYMGEKVALEQYQDMLQHPYGYGAVLGGGQLQTGVFLNALKSYFKEKKCYQEEKFDYEKLSIEHGKVVYKNLKARQVIFCEGYQVKDNPYFSYLPFDPAKGEVLLVRFPNHSPKSIIKHKLFIVPLGSDNLYWVGSNYSWNFADDSPTPEGLAYLKSKLEEFIKVPYEIVEHKAGIRPATKRRRPLMGIHPDIPEYALFNGLGTKGASLAPYWAKQFIDYLGGGTALDKEVDIQQI